MPCLSGFKLYSRWVPLNEEYCVQLQLWYTLIAVYVRFNRVNDLTINSHTNQIADENSNIDIGAL